jgi:hypothetical protein
MIFHQWTAYLFVLATTFGLTTANTRQPDPGTEDDILCTVEVVKMVRLGQLADNNLLLWPKGSCCTTTDCQLQKFSCPTNPNHTGSGGDICCYKPGGGAAAGTCKCGIDEEPQGTCF